MGLANFRPMKKTTISRNELIQLYSLASAPFLSEEFDDSNRADIEFLRLLSQVRLKGMKFAGISFLKTIAHCAFSR